MKNVEEIREKLSKLTDQELKTLWLDGANDHPPIGEGLLMAGEIASRWIKIIKEKGL